MSKSKQRSHSETEHLRGEIRELKKTNRSLLKQLRQFEKYEQQSFDNYVHDNEDTLPTKKIVCENCGKGTYNEIIVSNMIYGSCSLCNFKKRLK